MLAPAGSVLVPIALIVAAVVGGTIATYSFDRRTSLPWRVPAGVCIGLAALGLSGFILAMQFGLTIFVIAAAGAVAGSPVGLLLSDRLRRQIREDVAAHTIRLRFPAYLRRMFFVHLVVYGSGAALLWRVAGRAMFVREGGIYTGISHNIGDLPFHLSVISRFADGGNFPPEHPSFAGAGFTYPFLADFIAAMFVRAGARISTVIVATTMLLTTALAVLMYRWTLELTGNRNAAFLAPMLTLLSGGLGWWMFLTEAAQHAGGALNLLGSLPHDYTMTYDGRYRWGNIFTTLLVPQRSLLLGLPLTVIVFQNWWHATAIPGIDRSERETRMIAAGVVTGFLPLIHAHSFAVAIGIGVCLAAFSANRWPWMLFLSWALALGGPQILWMMQLSGVSHGAYIDWVVGWDRGTQNTVAFWLKNTGMLLPLILLALLWRGTRPLVPRPLLLFYLPFTLCFVIPNLFRLAPWIWDNIKILIYWFVASVPLVALLLARLAEGRWWRRGLAAVLFAALTLAGGLDLWRVASGGFESQIIDGRGIAFAAMVSDKTEDRALILHAPIHNHPIVMTGRRSLMGYAGHVWSHGLDYRPRETDMRHMYAGGPDAVGLIAAYRIDYVVVGPPEREQMTMREGFFERYPLVGEAGGYRLYRIASGQK